MSIISQIICRLGAPTPTAVEQTQAVIDRSTDPAWLAAARREIGVKEVRGGECKRILEYHGCTSLRATEDEVAWCSAFANWATKQAGIAGTNSAAARSWLSWGQPLKAPRLGCIVVFWRGEPTSAQGHVALYLGDDGPDRIRVIGGNQGDAVSVASYPRERVLAYRWPVGVP